MGVQQLLLLGFEQRESVIATQGIVERTIV